MSVLREDLWRCLVGEWRGAGAGAYPGVPAFRYLEHLTLALEPGWSMLTVLQRTWRDDGAGAGKALHLEAGVLQARDDGTLLFSCGQDSGRTEAMTGTVTRDADGLRIDWVTVAHGHDERLVRMGRTWWVGPSHLRYEAHLATVRTPEYRKHLEASLQRRAPA
jgi:hypothetical protein